MTSAFNYLLFPTLLLALGFFQCGTLVARRVKTGLVFRLMALVGVLVAVPGVAFVAYYLKLFHEPIWLYEFRSWPFSELAATERLLYPSTLPSANLRQPCSECISLVQGTA